MEHAIEIAPVTIRVLPEFGGEIFACPDLPEQIYRGFDEGLSALILSDAERIISGIPDQMTICGTSVASSWLSAILPITATSSSSS